MRKTIAKAVTWRLIGTAEIFAISFWTTGHISTAGHTAGIAAITSILMYVAHELAWGDGHEAVALCQPEDQASLLPKSTLPVPYLDLVLRALGLEASGGSTTDQ